MPSCQVLLLRLAADPLPIRSGRMVRPAVVVFPQTATSLPSAQRTIGLQSARRRSSALQPDWISKPAAAMSAGVGSVGMCAIVFTKDSFLFFSSTAVTTTDTARPKGRGVRGEIGVTKDGHQGRCPWWFCPW